MHTSTKDFVADQTTFRQLRAAVLVMCAGALLLVGLAAAISASL